MNSNLLKEAIADADAIKTLAIENAKASLNEAFDSKIKSMLAARLNEEAEETEEDDEKKDHMEEARRKSTEDDDYDDDDDDGEESVTPKKTKKTPDEEDGEDETDESFDIDEILAEMEDYGEMEEGEHSNDDDDDMNEGSYEEENEAYDNDIDESGWYSRKSGKKSLEEAEDDEEVDEELDLEALIREMEGDDDENDGHHMKEASRKSTEDDDYDDDDEEGEEGEEKASRHHKDSKVEEMKQELYESRRQSKKLIQKVNETNLINAKLLYLNKVLRNHNLNEQQKIKVITAFDRATTAREAKIVFESLNEAFSVRIERKKTGLKESFGFASKAAGTSTKREIITEADSHVARWQKLAGINRYL